MVNNIFVVIRIVLGVLFVISGLEKAISPMENFLYVIQGYDVIPDVLARLVAMTFPWIELTTGLFILLGLWTDLALVALMVISGNFIVIVGQAILRNLPLDNCGCFGNLVHLPLRGVLVLDTAVVICSFICFKNIDKTRLFSLDKLYSKS